MDPEIYVFPGIDSAPAKIAASTTLFITLLIISSLIIGLLLGSLLRSSIDDRIDIAQLSFILGNSLHILLGYTVFIYGSYHAWRATREKNCVEDLKHQWTTRILDTGYYGRVRHPMYGMFILANIGLGFALNSIYGLIFALLSLILFIANGIFEEQYVMLRFFGDAYRGYMCRVAARYFTTAQAIVLSLVLAIYAAGLFL